VVTDAKAIAEQALKFADDIATVTFLGLSDLDMNTLSNGLMASIEPITVKLMEGGLSHELAETVAFAITDLILEKVEAVQKSREARGHAMH
jgi:hypothetical protein